jgi:hypothetical protein
MRQRSAQPSGLAPLSSAVTRASFPPAPGSHAPTSCAPGDARRTHGPRALARAARRPSGASSHATTLQRRLPRLAPPFSDDAGDSRTLGEGSQETSAFHLFVSRMSLAR